MLAGAVLVLVGGLGFGVYALHTETGVDVVAVARPVSAGAVLSNADLRLVRLTVDPSLHVVSAALLSTVVGRTAAVPLAAGALLTAEQLGTSADPPPGQSVIAVAAKTGHVPAGLAPGATVVVLVVPPGSGTEPARAAAVVRHVRQADTGGLSVVTVQLASDAAVRLASTVGDVTLVQQSSAG